jgi:hypothetical protein
MQTITLKARPDADGVLRLEIPMSAIDQDVEIVLVMNPIPPKPLDEMGYPVGYFDATYGSLADDPIERNQPTTFDVRDEIE